MERFMDQQLYADTFDLFCENLPAAGVSVLDVACGPGNITRYLLNKRADLKILGIDLAPNMLRLAAQNNPEATFLQMDCRDILTLGNKYDGIMCGFFLPYLSKEEAATFIRDAASTLNTAGVLYLSTMEGDYATSGMQTSSSGDSSLFIHFHEAAYIIDALNEYGFKIIDLRRKEYPGKDGATVIDLIIIAGRSHP